MTMFEKAVRQKLRFTHKNFQKGLCSVEELWDLPLQELDKMYQELNAEIKEQQEDSLLEDKTETHNILKLKTDIVKHIVDVRLQEQKEREEAAKREQDKQKILSIIEEKEEDNLRDKSADELRELVKKM